MLRAGEKRRARLASSVRVNTSTASNSGERHLVRGASGRYRGYISPSVSERRASAVESGAGCAKGCSGSAEVCFPGEGRTGFGCDDM